MTSYHLKSPTLLLHDKEPPPGSQDLEAHVRSGDYFSTLATALDGLTANLPAHGDEVMYLEQFVRDLLYLDDHYQIVPKD